VKINFTRKDKFDDQKVKQKLGVNQVFWKYDTSLRQHVHFVIQKFLILG